MIVVDYIAYFFVAIPIIIGLSLCCVFALAMVVYPILWFVDEIQENPQNAWFPILLFFVAISAFWLDLRNRGLL